MSADIDLRVNGTWLRGSGLGFSDLSWIDKADGGNFEASWSMTLGYGVRPAAVFKGASVEVMLSAERRFYGVLTEADWAAGSFTAQGQGRRADNYLALDLLGKKSSVPDTVIDRAINFLGWAITRPVSFGAVSALVDDQTDPVTNTVAQILDAAVEPFGQRWGIWGDGVIAKYTLPTTPTYFLAPGVLELGETAEDTYSNLILTYLDSGTGAIARTGGSNGTLPMGELVYDISTRGAISNATANTIVNSVIASSGSGRGWSTSIEVAATQLTTVGGLPADLPSVTAGQMMRAYAAETSGLDYVDLVIGQTAYAAGADTITLAPIDKVATSMSEVFEDVFSRVTGIPAAA